MQFDSYGTLSVSHLVTGAPMPSSGCYWANCNSNCSKKRTGNATKEIELLYLEIGKPISTAILF